MYNLRVRNVEEALDRGLKYLDVHGVETPSRGGQIKALAEPACTTYQFPMQRVVLNEGRDAHPFFHFFEALWMLDGRNDADFVAQFLPRMRQYADDGVMMQGAYGWRWRASFERDQLEHLVGLLRRDPYSRRAVLQMWDGQYDLDLTMRGSADVPCNVAAVFERSRRDEQGLDLTVFCRSNDALWGAWGANAVHFSMLLEYMADRLGWPIGEYRQMSVNLHYYVEARNRYPFEMQETGRYRRGEIGITPIGAHQDGWHEDLKDFLDHPRDFGCMGQRRAVRTLGFRTHFFSTVVAPLYLSWTLYREARKPDEALAALAPMYNADWAVAAREWINRRVARKALQNPAAYVPDELSPDEEGT